MYEDLEFCDACGRKLVRRLGAVRYDTRTGRANKIEWVIFCPGHKWFSLPGSEFVHIHKHWWEDIGA